MGEALDASALARWRREPASFISDVLIDPETRKPFDLLPAERKFLDHAFQTTDDGRLLYPEQVYSAPKKSGKTGFAAMHLLTTTLVFGGAFAEGYAVANDLEQAQGRTFQAARRIVEASPYLRREANVTDRVLRFPATGATISAIASDYAGAAGANPTISAFDELWGYTSERARRLWDEMVPPPTRKIACRFTVTYAGFQGESELLEELYKRGLAQLLVGPDLHAGDGLLCFWTHSPVAPWQDEAWLAQMRKQLRPNAYLRLIENRFVGSESTFIEMAWWDTCVDADLSPVIADRSLPVWIGVDASVKRDSTAIVAVTMKDGKVRLVAHRIFQPSPDDPLDFENTIETTVKDLHARFRVRGVRYDPYQMQSTAQRLTRAGIKMEEFPQTVPNLTEASQNLYELIKGRNLVAYPDEANRLSVSRAIAVETPRGWRIAKDKASHKIDFVVALAMASHAAVQQQSTSDTSYAWVDNEGDIDWNTMRRNAYIASGGWFR
jgi:phage terminase large subunit-like protein